jgi:fused signal recognition particle receptor
VEILERLRRGLGATRSVLATRLAATGWAITPESLEEILLLADSGLEVAEEMSREYDRACRRGDVKAGGERDWLQARMTALLIDAERPIPRGAPHVTMVVGVNGSGKTTTAAKLAARLRADGARPLLVAADTFRAAAIEQLRAWGDRLGVAVVAQRPGSDPGAVVFDAFQAAGTRGASDLVIDTAGRLHTKHNLMAELDKIRRVCARIDPRAPHEVLLVLDATTGTNGVAQVREFRAAAGVTGVALTKLDGTAKGGVVLAVARELGVPVRWVGVGETAEDLLPFAAGDFVTALLGEAA